MSILSSRPPHSDPSTDRAVLQAQATVDVMSTLSREPSLLVVRALEGYALAIERQTQASIACSRAGVFAHQARFAEAFQEVFQCERSNLQQENDVRALIQVTLEIVRRLRMHLPAETCDEIEQALFTGSSGLNQRRWRSSLKAAGFCPNEAHRDRMWTEDCSLDALGEDYANGLIAVDYANELIDFGWLPSPALAARALQDLGYPGDERQETRAGGGRAPPQGRHGRYRRAFASVSTHPKFWRILAILSSIDLNSQMAAVETPAASSSPVAGL